MTGKTSTHTPKDISYIDSLTSHVSFKRDISLEEADDLYLLFKMYQALKTAALKVKGPVRQLKMQPNPACKRSVRGTGLS